MGPCSPGVLWGDHSGEDGLFPEGFLAHFLQKKQGHILTEITTGNETTFNLLALFYFFNFC